MVLKEWDKCDCEQRKWEGVTSSASNMSASTIYITFNSRMHIGTLCYSIITNRYILSLWTNHTITFKGCTTTMVFTTTIYCTITGPNIGTSQKAQQPLSMIAITNTQQRILICLPQATGKSTNKMPCWMTCTLVSPMSMLTKLLTALRCWWCYQS